jgi:hypothetical protein
MRGQPGFLDDEESGPAGRQVLLDPMEEIGQDGEEGLLVHVEQMFQLENLEPTGL